MNTRWKRAFNDIPRCISGKLGWWSRWRKWSFSVRRFGFSSECFPVECLHKSHNITWCWCQYHPRTIITSNHLVYRGVWTSCLSNSTLEQSSCCTHQHYCKGRFRHLFIVGSFYKQSSHSAYLVYPRCVRSDYITHQLDLEYILPGGSRALSIWKGLLQLHWCRANILS
jgi:hypothetical protein